MHVFTSNWMLFFPVAFSLFVALRLNEGSRDQVQPGVASLILRTLAVLFFGFAVLAIGLRLSWLSSMWLLLLAALVSILAWKNRRLDRSAMLLTMMHAANPAQRQQVIQEFTNANRGHVRRRAAALSRDLRNGCDWVAALEVQGIARSLYEKLWLRLQARYGTSQLQGSGSDSLLTRPIVIEQEVERLIGRLLLFSWIVLLIPVISLYMVFIVPTFEEMFEEFGLLLPPAMDSVVYVSHNMQQFGVIIAFVLLPLGLLLGLSLLLWLFPQLTQLPGVQWVFRDYFRNLGFSGLIRALEVEPNLMSACRSTAELVPVPRVAEGYHRAAELMTAGIHPGDAFLQAGLLRASEVAALTQGLESRQPGWGLRQLANWRIERMLRRYSAIVQGLVITLTLLLATIVGTVALGVIQTLATMIMALS